MRNALVIGGTGPTGPHVLQGLLDRGYDTTIFHRGTHEPAELPEVRHIHGDPHFRESIHEMVGTGEYDLVVAAYGRTKLLAESFRERAGHFIAVGGPPRYTGFYEPDNQIPSGPTVPIREDASLVGAAPATDDQPGVRFGYQMVQTEQAVFTLHPSATCLIYPIVYGARNVIPWEWSVIKRVQDGRAAMVLPDDGLAIHSRGAAENLAHSLLLAVDNPTIASGQVYNCADDEQFSLRQWTQLIVQALGGDIAIVGIPSALAPLFKAIYIPTASTICAHSVLDTSKVRAELGYRDVIRPLDALERSVAWYRANPVDMSAAPPAFVDRFDYELEDTLIESWFATVEDFADRIPQPLPDDVHPMPHPKRPNQLVDEKSR